MNSFDASDSAEEIANAKRLEKLRESLRNRLLQEVQASDLESNLLDFLRRLGNRLPIKEMLARKLAEHFIQTWTFVKSNSVKELIERRPEEIDAALKSIRSENVTSLLKLMPSVPNAERKRVKPANEQEKRKNIARAKNRYDRGRPYHPTRMGIIEREFGEPMKLLDPSRSSPPWGPCLDNLFRGGVVKMSSDVYCLEDLFGMDRHRLPENLPSMRRGRERLYNLKAVIECMDRLLGDDRPSYRWLREPTKRNVVLNGVINRAKQAGSPEVAADVAQTLACHLS
jgi:hypothetical protein